MNNLNFISPIGYTGYGITSLNILKELNNRCKISLFCLSDIKRLSLNDESESSTIRETLSNAKYFDSQCPNLKIWHPNDLSMRASKGDLFVFPFFEIDYIPDIDKHHLNSCDTIFTASNWGKQILQQNGITTKTIVCPLGVDTNIFYPDEVFVENNKDKNKYVFLHIGKWEKRKSQDIVLKCFEKAFDLSDNVELWLVPHNPFLNNEELSIWYNMVYQNNLKEKIKIFPRLPTQHDLNNVINLSDCGVFISRAEGWNNEILETMAANKPVICTNYSAHTEYCNNNNSYLVEINQLEPANDNKWFFGEGNWAKINNTEEDIVVEHMKYVYNNDIRTNNSGLDTAQQYSWKKTANIIYETIYANS